jgi:iron complex outermembrane receptor protein
VLTPTFIPGFTTSLDYYSIVIKSAIFTVGATQAQQQCALGITVYCSQLHFAVGTTPDPLAPLSTPDYPGALVLTISLPQNASEETTSGFDYQADYSMDAFGGNINWHFLGNFTDESTRTALGLEFESAGSLSGSAPLTGNLKLKFNLSATYTEGPWSGTIQGRFKGPAHLNLYWTNGVNVDNNDIPWVAYLDVRGSYKWNNNISLYGGVNDVNDAPPPLIPTAQGGAGTNTQIYDGQGRIYNAGIRFNF